MKWNQNLLALGSLGGLLVVVGWWFGGKPGWQNSRAEAALPAARKAVSQSHLRAADHGRIGTPVAQSAETEFVSDIAAAPLLNQIAAAMQESRSEPELQKLVAELAGNLPATLDTLWNKESLSGAEHALRVRLLQHWAETSPAAAAEWLTQKPANAARQEALSSVAAAWANQSLDDAVAWARQWPEVSEREQCLSQIAYEAARTAPVAAMKLAVAMPESASRDDLLAHASAQWAGTEPQVAAEWVSQIQDVTLRERLLAQVTTIWGGKSPVDAAAFAVKFMSQGGRQDDAVVGIVQQWAQQEPAAAAAWVTAFPAGNLRDVALENVVKLWTDQDREQMGNWLNRLEPGPSRDLAVSVYVGKVAPALPLVAAQWAEGIGDEALRLQGLQTAGENWLASDAAAARAWISQSALPEATKAQLLTPGIVPAP